MDDTLKNHIYSTFDVNVKLVGKAQEPEVLISVGAKEDDWHTNEADRKRPSMKDIEFYSTKEPLTRRAINLKARAIYGLGFTIIGKDDKAAQAQQALDKCEEIITQPDFEENCIEMTKQAIAYGYSVPEYLWDTAKTNIVKIHITDPKSMEPLWDEHGTITKIKQTVVAQGETKTNTWEYPFDPESKEYGKFGYLMFDRIADGIRGLGIVETLIPTIHTLMSIRKSIKELIFRYGEPFTHMTKIGAGKKDVPKMSRVVSNIGRSKSFASSEKYDFKFHWPTGGSADLRPQLNFIVETIAGAFGVPVALLLQNGEKANKASLEQMDLWSKEDIRFYQKFMSMFIETQIFTPVLIKNNIDLDFLPSLQWNELSPEDETAANKRRLDLVKILDAAELSGYIDKVEATKLFREEMGLKEESKAEGGEEDEAGETKPTDPEEEGAEEIAEAIEEQQAQKNKFADSTKLKKI